MFFLGSLSIQCRIRCNRSRWHSAINLLANPGLF